MKRLIGKMSETGRDARRPAFSISARQVMVCVLLAMAVIGSALSCVWSATRVVTIAQSEAEPERIWTFRKDVAGVFEEKGITLAQGDKMNVSLQAPLTDDMTIEIYRAIPVTITAMGEEKQYLTTERTVQSVLADAGFSVGEKDIVTPDLACALSGGEKITLVKVEEEVVTAEEEIPFAVKEKINADMNSGETKIAQEGKAGTKQYSYLVSYQDGAEASRVLVGERILEEPVDEIKEIGTKVTASNFRIASAGSLPSRGGSMEYSQVLQCSATAYDLSYASCGKNPGDPGYGRTASGRQAQYGVVAVDPRIIPMGSRLYIEATDGSWTYGYAVAGDTGSAIKGNRIDLFFNSRAEALNFGRRSAKVYILK